MAYLEITEVVLAHFNIVNNIFRQIQESCLHLQAYAINRLVSY